MKPGMQLCPLLLELWRELGMHLQLWRTRMQPGIAAEMSLGSPGEKQEQPQTAMQCTSRMSSLPAQR